jgi:SAM-dependent methyltransferase
VSPTSQARATAALSYLSEAAAAVAAVRTASNLGVLDLLESEPAHTGHVAEQLRLSPRGTAHLLEALTGLELLAHGEHGYTPTLARSARCAVGALMWDALGETVRTGTGPHHVDTVAGSGAVYQDVVGFLGDLSGPLADAAAKHLLVETVPGHVLDVGAGAAPWSRALARQAPTARVTALDLPSILSVTRTHVHEDTLSGQFTYLAGDAFSVDLDRAAYDLILLPNVCHLFSSGANQALLGRLAPSLRSGGRIAVIDVLPGGTPELVRWVSLYALGLMVRTDAGGVYCEADYRAWLRAAGLGEITRWDVTPVFPVAVITGRA